MKELKLRDTSKRVFIEAYWWAGACLFACVATGFIVSSIWVAATDFWTAKGVYWDSWTQLNDIYGISRLGCIRLNYALDLALAVVFSVMTFVWRVKTDKRRLAEEE
ncbi:hypothetical protein IJ556_02230 [bacterium]|nr:hypothetical protein [bacterium]